MYAPWHDLIEECLSQAPYLASTFLTLLSEYNDYQEVNIWLNKLKTSPETLAPHIQFNAKLYMTNHPNEDLFSQTENNSLDLELAEKFHSLSISNVKLIDTETGFHDFLADVLTPLETQDVIFVGMDVEWKPTCIGGVCQL